MVVDTFLMIFLARVRVSDATIGIGQTLGKLYTERGLPPDTPFGLISGSQEYKVGILCGLCDWLIEHKRKSGATERSLNRQRSANVKMCVSFIETGEIGIY